MKKKGRFLLLLLLIAFMTGCASESATIDTKKVVDTNSETLEKSENQIQEKEVATPEEPKEAVKENPIKIEKTPAAENKKEAVEEPFKGYTLLVVDGGDKSGTRKANAVVDIGFGAREYWGFTNEYGQLVRVTAKEIVLQDDTREPVTSSGRYFSDEAKVPGTESSELDEGHVIADSLGGVSNAYNITPQNSTLNRHGDQAYMERNIREAGGATNFEAIITYPNTKTQTPSHYKYTYTIKGNVIVDSFKNINPDEVNKSLGLTESAPKEEPSSSGKEDVSLVDTNGNGQITIKEAKDAGVSMPIKRGHWLYPYMRDNDNDGMVGE